MPQARRIPRSGLATLCWIFRVIFTVLMLVLAPSAALADDISAASRSVVRVVVVVWDNEGSIVGFGHGSGFAISRNQVVTNAHVLAEARRYPQNAVIGVVPSEGKKARGAKLVRINTFHDLAVLKLEEGTLPPLALFVGPLSDGASVVALGYPGSVDLATLRGAGDFITPSAPTRAPGSFSNRRDWQGTDTLLHTAPIAGGNSGGPLVDDCGRVLGVNTFTTSSGASDSSFGFAVSSQELIRFLREGGISFSTVASECVSIADRLREEQAREAREASEAAAKEAAVEQARAEAMRKAEAETEDKRENLIALALGLGVFGLVALGAGGLLLLKEKQKPSYAAAALGVVLMVGAALVFLGRPARGDLELEKPIEPAEATMTEHTGAAVCRFVPERSRVTVSSTEDVPIDWDSSGCMNGRTQFVEIGDSWSRILVPNEDQVVSVLEFSPSKKEYVASRYLLSLQEMEKARALRRQTNIQGCPSNGDALTAFEAQQYGIRHSLPELPNERLVYRCSN